MARRLTELRTGHQQPAGKRLRVKSGDQVCFVEVESIDWVEANGNYVRLYAGGEVHLMRETMTGLIEKIGSDRLVRIHRSRIVNVRRVKELVIASGADYQVVLWDGTKLGLSRVHRDALRKQLTVG